MTAPRVSVGLPVYNGEQFLGAAIESITAQDFTDFELLIGDNGSTDSTPDICASYAAQDPRISVRRSAENRGAAWNYNRLVDIARGEYFKWAAHDDLLAPGFLRRCVDVLDADPDVSLCYTKAVDIDAGGAVLAEHTLPAYAVESQPSRRVRRVLFEPSPCLESFGLTRRAQLNRTNRIGGYTGSDRTLFLELSMMGRFHEVPEVLFLHRQHPGRSVHRYADGRARNVWFDPSWSGRRSAPRWRLLREYAAAIARAPIPAAERARVAALLPGWAARNRSTLVREAAGFFVRPRLPA
jgi:glycosyltransferase involved in cell wall biosynthesis